MDLRNVTWHAFACAVRNEPLPTRAGTRGELELATPVWREGFHQAAFCAATKAGESDPQLKLGGLGWVGSGVVLCQFNGLGTRLDKLTGIQPATVQHVWATRDIVTADSVRPVLVEALALSEREADQCYWSAWYFMETAARLCFGVSCEFSPGADGQLTGLTVGGKDVT